MDLKSYVTTTFESLDQRREFAERCGFSLGHLNNLMHGCKPCCAEYAINIDRETGGRVPAEKMAPSVDWAVLRNKPKRAGADKHRAQA